MTSPIQIPVRFEGAEQGAALMEALTRSLGGLQQSTDRMAQAAESFGQRQQQANERVQQGTRGATEATQQAIQFTQRIASAAAAVQSLAASFGDNNSPAGLVARTAASVAQFAQLGSMLGPGGAVLGAIAGAAVAINELAAAHSAAAVAARTQQEALTDLANAANGARRIDTDLATGGTAAGIGSASERAAAYQARLRRRQELLTQISAAQEGQGRIGQIMGTADLSSRTEARLRQDLDALNAEITRLERGMDTASEDPLAAIRADIGSGEVGYGGHAPTREDVHAMTGTADATDTHRRSAAPGGPRNSAMARLHGEALESRLGEGARLEREANEVLRQQRQEMHDEQRQYSYQRQADIHTEMELTKAQQHEEQEAAHDRKTRADQEMERVRHEKEEKRAAYDQQVQGYQSVTSAVVNNIVAAGEALASGSMTAEQAFKRMLASFLEMISQRAALEAASEYASAIASFARYDYSGGAQHAAAGVAWTAVAIAAGAGGAALSASAQGGSAAAGGGAPGRLPQQGGGAQQGGGTTVINFNSPVVTAGSTNELGRQLTRLVDRSRVVYPSG